MAENKNDDFKHLIHEYEHWLDGQDPHFVGGNGNIKSMSIVSDLGEEEVYKNDGIKGFDVEKFKNYLDGLSSEELNAFLESLSNNPGLHDVLIDDKGREFDYNDIQLPRKR